MRYTIKQMNAMSDKEFAISVLNERLNGLTNPYSPFSEKLRKTIKALEDEDVHPVVHGKWESSEALLELQATRCSNCKSEMNGGSANE